MSPLSFHSDLRGGERPAPPYRSGISRFDAVRRSITNMKKKKEKSLSGGAVNTSRPDGFGSHRLNSAHARTLAPHTRVGVAIAAPTHLERCNREIYCPGLFLR